MIEVSSTVPLIAKEDITSYKLVYYNDKKPEICYSSVFNTMYFIGGTTPSEEALVVDGPYNDVTEGYPEFWIVKSGFASYREKPVPYSEGMYVAKCKIPKNSTYLVDQYNTCYVSSKIIIEEILR